MKPTNMRRRVRHEERGVALIVVLGAIMVISIFVAVVMSLVFVSGLDIWAPRLAFIATRPVFVTWFVLATAFCIWLVIR